MIPALRELRLEDCCGFKFSLTIQWLQGQHERHRETLPQKKHSLIHQGDLSAAFFLIRLEFQLHCNFIKRATVKAYLTRRQENYPLRQDWIYSVPFFEVKPRHWHLKKMISSVIKWHEDNSKGDNFAVKNKIAWRSPK